MVNIVGTKLAVIPCAIGMAHHQWYGVAVDIDDGKG